MLSVWKCGAVELAPPLWFNSPIRNQDNHFCKLRDMPLILGDCGKVGTESESHGMIAEVGNVDG